jgi:hypothetical protein
MESVYLNVETGYFGHHSFNHVFIRQYIEEPDILDYMSVDEVVLCIDYDYRKAAYKDMYLINTNLIPKEQHLNFAKKILSIILSENLINATYIGGINFIRWIVFFIQ